MLISELSNREEILSIIGKQLKDNYGIKIRIEKQKQWDLSKRQKKVFKTRLENQLLDNAIFSNGSVASVPRFMLLACQLIQKDSKCEGIFRKTGSIQKQQAMKEQLERNSTFNDKINVIDIANLLKTYLRELPEPLIPTGMIQDALIRCLIQKSNYENKVESILNICLFLPTLTVNTLAYFLQFLEVITKDSHQNRMTIGNLVKVLTPTIMPISPNAPEKRLESHFKIVELLIENANLIGVVPDKIVKRDDITIIPPMTEERKKKKRRSGSLNRVFSGIRKIVGALGSSESLDKSHEGTVNENLSILTPNLTKSSKKRRLEKFDMSVFSSKKRKDHMLTLSALPEIEDNFSPYGNKKMGQQRKSLGEKTITESSPPKIRRLSLAPDDTLVRKRNIVKKQTLNERNEEEYVKIPKSEYESFKNRLSSIETKITHEFNAVKLDVVKSEMGKSDDSMFNGPDKVETKFNEILQETEKFEDSDRKTDQLAKRLSRELKIRAPIDNAIIRSPSARKIGSLRRLRRDSSARLSRNQSWHLGSSSSSAVIINQTDDNNSFSSSLSFYPKPNVKRARMLDSDKNVSCFNNENLLPSIPQSTEKVVPEKPIRKMTNVSSNLNTEVWTPATDFFNDLKTDKLIDDDGKITQQNDSLFKTPVRPKKLLGKCEIDVNKTPMLPPRLTPARPNVTPMRASRTPGSNIKSAINTPSGNEAREARASIIQIRCQNAGMVAQKAKLFDGLSADLVKSAEKSITIPRVLVNKPLENLKNNDKMPQKYLNNKNINVPLTSNSPRRSSRSPGINRRHQLRVAVSSPILKTIKESNENTKRKINLLKSDLLHEIASPLKREQNENRKLSQNNTPRRTSKTPVSNKKKLNRTPRRNQTPSKSPRVYRRNNIAFD